jgi:hypothetical protein
LAALAMLCLPAIVLGEEGLDCYDGPFESVLLDGCTDDCRSFETLQEAEDHCNSIQDCGGITKTAYGDEEAIHLGVGLYEVRSGPGIQQQVGDTTWIKQDGCGGPRLSQGVAGADDGETATDRYGRLNNFNQMYEQQEDWNESLDGVADGYRKAFVQMFWMAMFLAVGAGAIFFSYRRGDQTTVEYVERAREKIGELMNKRGPRINESLGSYQSL